MSHTDDVINRTFKRPRQKQQKMEISKLDQQILISTADTFIYYKYLEQHFLRFSLTL